jgi:hypothetical protein
MGYIIWGLVFKLLQCKIIVIHRHANSIISGKGSLDLSSSNHLLKLRFAHLSLLTYKWPTFLHSLLNFVFNMYLVPSIELNKIFNMCSFYIDIKVIVFDNCLLKIIAIEMYYLEKCHVRKHLFTY